MPDQTEPTPRAMLAAIQTLRVPTDAERAAIYGFDRLSCHEVGPLLVATADRGTLRVVVEFSPNDVARAGSAYAFELDVLDRLAAALSLVSNQVAPPTVLS